MFYSLRSTEMYFSSGIIIIKCSIDAIIFEWNQQVKKIVFNLKPSTARHDLHYRFYFSSFFYTYERTCMKNGLPNETRNDRWMEMEVARFDVIVHGVCSVNTKYTHE